MNVEWRQAAADPRPSQYLYAKNYQNTMQFDKVIAKIIRGQFLPHSVQFVHG